MRKNKIKYMSLVAATLFAVSPVASLTNFANPTVVKADSQDPIKIITTLKKSRVILQPGHNWNGNELANNVNVNIGDTSYNYAIRTYKADSKGKVDLSQQVNESQLKPGTTGIVEINIFLDIIGSEKNYTFQTVSDSSGELVWQTADGFDAYNKVWVAIPFVVAGGKTNTTNSKAKTKIKKVSKAKNVKKSTKAVYYFVNARKGRKVRTYTASGRFSKHYVYGRSRYRITMKKRIKHIGLSYKLYGKNQWVPARYLKR